MAALIALVLAACGGGGGQASAVDGGGDDVDEGPDALQAAVASFDVAAGPPGRFLVGLFSADRRLVAHGAVELSFSYLGTRADAGTTTPEPGPVAQARFLPLPGSEALGAVPTEPVFVSGSGSRGVYEAEVAFDRAGFWQVEVTAVVDGVPRRAEAAFEVLAENKVPTVGEDAPRTVNHTVDSPPEVPRAAIDSRFTVTGEVDPVLHDRTVAAALDAGRPVVLVISTPVYCRSQFCGPVTDMVAEVAGEYGGAADFVHIEVWRDFQALEINAAAAEWILQDGAEGNEPWVFVIGGDGVIRARFDNVVNRADLVEALEALDA